MKNTLLLLLLATSSAHGQEAECPKFYPWQDTILAETPYQHNGKGVVAREELSGASAMGGAFNARPPFEFHGGPDREVPGGVDVVMPKVTQWLVCWYGKGRSIAWWEELKHDPETVQGCTMKIRDKVGRDPMDIRLVCK